jgi:photosystem II stability/assembly factor-like uncharacterized protein
VGSLPANSGANQVVIDSQQPKRVYALAKTIYRSDDAGQTWRPADRGLSQAKIVVFAIDPLHSQRLYAATAVGRLYVTNDGAGSWGPVEQR